MIGGEGMASLSNLIEAFIKELMEQQTSIEIQRNELAKAFQCAPSQINYVLMTRFSPEHGYLVESQRGGGGYIKIRRITINSGHHAYYYITKEIGDRLSKTEAFRIIDFLHSQNWINQREMILMKSALDERALPQTIVERDFLRASILKQMLSILLE